MTTFHRFILLLGLVSVTTLAACSDDNNSQLPSIPTSTADMATPQVDMAKEQDLPGAMVDLSQADMPKEWSAKEGCNPLSSTPGECMLPYPSDFFLLDDASTPSKKRVALTEPAKLQGRADEPFDAIPVTLDGFSTHQPIIAYFGEELDLDNVTFHDGDIGATLDSKSTTLILNATTGEPVAHWAETDLSEPVPQKRAFILRLLNNLEPQTRYIVAIQGLKNSEGQLVATPPGFEQLRDSKDAITDPLLAPVSTRYESQIFPALKTFGVSRQSLQLAWDFTTRSEASVTSDLLAMRKDLFTKLEATPPKVTVTNVLDSPNSSIARRIEGTLEVPLYLDENKTLSRINRDASGTPVANGTIEVPFLVQVPNSAVPVQGGNPDAPPARLLQYGHGFFGEREEINYGSFMRTYSDEQRFVTAAVDWQGMSQEDLVDITGAINQSPQDIMLFTNTIHQGIVNFLALSFALKTTIAQLDALKMEGKPLYDANELYYYGISQGHIFGVTFLALSPHVKRAVMNVGGAPYSFMMSRSLNFGSFLALVRVLLRRQNLDIQKFVSLVQHGFDRVDPSTWARYVNKNKLEGAPEDRVVVSQFGLWDHSVPTLAGLNLARMMDLPLLAPSPVTPYGFTTVDAPSSQSAAVLLDYNVPQPPVGYFSTPAKESDKTVVHEAIRNNPAIKKQVDALLKPDGTIQHFCDGPCDPE